MKEDSLLKRLGVKWGVFAEIIFSPGSSIFIALGAFCLFFSIFVFVSPLSDFLSILSAVLTAVAGIFIKDDWDKLRGESILEKKGLSAIRNLDSLAEQLTRLRKWTENFISMDTEKKRDLEEINRHLETMRLSIRSGLADWADIVPELKKLKEAEERYRGTVEAYVEEILESKKKLLGAGEDKESRERLESRIRELEDSVEKLREEQPKVFSSAASGAPLVDSLSPVWDPYASRKICSRCGRTYREDPFSLSAQGVSFSMDSNLCPECERIQKSPGGL